MATLCHELIARTAKQMCHELYEVWAKDNEWFKFNPSETEFVREKWPLMVQPAREALAALLREGNVPEQQKEQILFALQTDWGLKGKKVGQVQ